MVLVFNQLDIILFNILKEDPLYFAVHLVSMDILRTFSPLCEILLLK